MEPDRATRFVQDQVVQLREDLFDFLYRACTREINHAYWDEMGELDPDSKFEIRNAVTEAFEISSRRWYSISSVLNEIESVAEIIKDSMEIALNVLRPEFPDGHIQRVIENVMDMFDRRWGPRLERVMLDYVEGAIKIQDVWRRCYYDPKHPTCRRRLLREFEGLAYDLERLRP